jgi:hypothetical protein
MWQFRKDGQRKWYWKEFDEMGRLLQDSAQFFRERIDCVVHAMRHGYVHPRQRALLAARSVESGAQRAYAKDTPTDARERAERRGTG